MAIIRIGQDNEITVPKHILAALGAKSGDLVEVEFREVVESEDEDTPLTEAQQEALREARDEVAAGKVHGPFKTAREAIEFLKAPLADSDSFES